MQEYEGIALGDRDRMVVQLRHHGGHDGVTGSCHQLLLDGRKSLLVDCGLFQGAETAEAGGDDDDRHRVTFPVADIVALVVTHVHIDHVGRIPWLLAAGYQGPIICSEPSAELLPLMLEDAFRLAVTTRRDVVDNYLRMVKGRLVPLAYKTPHTLLDTAERRVRIRLQPAGLLVLESTYGDRLHEDRRTRRERLRQAIVRAMADRGSVLIPAFSIGRTQEILYELEEMLGRGTVPDFEVILDSPLADRITDAYSHLQPWWDKEAQRRLAGGRNPLHFPQLRTVSGHEDHLELVEELRRTGRPAVVVAGSGMCTGGRIVNYLKAMLGDRRHCVLFVGYQAAGTPGRDILTYGPKGGYVFLDGEKVVIRTSIATIGGYSAHADQAGLVRFATRMRRPPEVIRLVHGEVEAREALRLALAQAGSGVVVPAGR